MTDPRTLLARALASPGGADSLNPEDAAVAALGAAALRAQLEARANAAPEPLPPRSDAERLLTVAEVAERLQVSERWVRERARRWAFAVRISRRVLRIPERKLEAWLRSNLKNRP
jgi:hypothetical protein